jgi:hypothetical protein
MDTELAKKSRKYPFINVSELAKQLHVSRISLYKYFDLFEKLPPEKPFDLADIAKVSPLSVNHYKKHRIEFLIKLSQLYWDSKTKKINNYRFDQVIFEYVPRSLVEDNLNKSILAKHYIEYKMHGVNKFYDGFEEKTTLKTEELLKVFNGFIKEFKGNNQHEEIFQKLIEYMEFIKSKYKDGK